MEENIIKSHLKKHFMTFFQSEMCKQLSCTKSKYPAQVLAEIRCLGKVYKKTLSSICLIIQGIRLEQSWLILFYPQQFPQSSYHVCHNPRDQPDTRIVIESYSLCGGDREGRVCVRRGNVLAFFNGLIKIYSVTLGI